MKYNLALTLAATGAVARTVPRAIKNNLDIGITPNNTIPVFQTHSWPRLTPDQALNALHVKAQEDPNAVDFLPGIPIPDWLKKDLGNAIHNITDAIEGVFEETKQPKPAGKAELANDEVAKGAAEDATAATCTNPAVHYEWRALTDQHKQQFTAAIKCLMGKPARSGLPSTHSRWDDLAAIHQHMSSTIHNVGQFLPWHRYFLWIFEQELRKTCGYTGPMAWWDETKDAGHFSAAPMFTQTYFGHCPDGNPVCITSGQFANLQLYIGPGQGNSKHCLSRGCNEGLSSQINTNFVNTCNSYTSYNDMQSCSFFGPHAYGHDAIGAVMSDVDSSPGDPAFFLHHAFIDHNWRIWQNVNANRKYAIGGYTTQNCGSHCTPTTLNYVLSSLNFYPSVRVGDVMDTEGGFLCYKYNY